MPELAGTCIPACMLPAAPLEPPDHLQHPGQYSNWCALLPAMQVFKLMEPHCRYTMNIGAAARMQFLAPKTVIEGSFTTGTAHAPLWALS